MIEKRIHRLGNRRTSCSRQVGETDILAHPAVKDCGEVLECFKLVDFRDPEKKGDGLEFSLRISEEPYPKREQPTAETCTTSIFHQGLDCSTDVKRRLL